MHTHVDACHPDQMGATSSSHAKPSRKRDLQVASVREAKIQADRLVDLFAAKKLSLSRSEALEGVAKLHGVRDWNTLLAHLNARAAPCEAPDAQKGAEAPEDANSSTDFDPSSPEKIIGWFNRACSREGTKVGLWEQRSISLISAIAPALCLRADQEGVTLDLKAVRTVIQMDGALELLTWVHQTNPEGQEFHCLRHWFDTLPGFDFEGWLLGASLGARTVNQYCYASMLLTHWMSSGHA